MDTPGGLKEGGADNALRDLFRSDGAFSAPDDMDARIMQRIAPAPVKEKALLPSWTWILVAAAFLIPLFVPYQSKLKLPDIGKWMPDLVAGSSWLLPLLVCAIALLGLEVWLIRRRTPTAHN